MNETEFKLAYVKYCQSGGHSFDEWDMSTAWIDYQAKPERWEFLKQYV